MKGLIEPSVIMAHCEHNTLVLRRSSSSVTARCMKCWKRIFGGADHVLAWERGIRERNKVSHVCMGGSNVISLQRSGDEILGKCNSCGSIVVKEFSVHVEKGSVVYPQIEQAIITWKLA